VLYRPLVALVAMAGVASATLGCSALTRPDEITITAEPAAAPAPPAAVQPSPTQPIQLGAMPQKAPGQGG
jgi:hypothetical protein